MHYSEYVNMQTLIVGNVVQPASLTLKLLLQHTFEDFHSAFKLIVIYGLLLNNENNNYIFQMTAFCWCFCLSALNGLSDYLTYHYIHMLIAPSLF